MLETWYKLGIGPLRKTEEMGGVEMVLGGVAVTVPVVVAEGGSEVHTEIVTDMGLAVPVVGSSVPLGVSTVGRSAVVGPGAQVGPSPGKLSEELNTEKEPRIVVVCLWR